MKKYTPFVLCLIVLFFAKGVSAKESCQITLSSAQASPSSITISGSLDRYNESLGCAKWTIMENTVGTLSVYSASGQKIAGPITITGPASSGYPDYIYQFPISFSQTIALDGDVPLGGKVTLSDYGENDPFEGEEISTKTVFINSSGTSSMTSGSFTGFKKFLKYGMKKNIEVMEMQKVLQKKGFFSGEATGDFGPKTRGALKRYQKSRGLEQTGGCGPKTRAWLTEDQ